MLLRYSLILYESTRRINIEECRQGKSAEEAIELTTQSVKLSKLAGMEASAATTDLTSALNGYKLESADASSVVDKLVAVDNSA